MRWFSLFALLATVMPAAVVAQDTPEPSSLPKGIPAGSVEAKATGAEDGEKLLVEIDGEPETVRFLGVDAPEPDNGGNPECYFEDSRDHLERMLKGRTVYLERDQTDKDGKERLMRYVWFVGKTDKKAHMANEVMAHDGFVIFKNEEKDDRYEKRLRAAEREAKNEEVGIWGECGGGHVAVTPVPELGESGDPAPIGTTLNTEGQDITITSAFYSYDYGFSTPKGGYVYLVIEATIANEDDEEHGYEGSRFSAKDLDTQAEFDDTFTLIDGGLGSGKLSPGEYVSGIVVLEVQETGGPIRIKYDASFTGAGEVYWVVAR